MKYKKFKLKPELRRNLEILNSSLSQKVVGGTHGPDDVVSYDGCGAQCEVTCANYCLASCNDFCGSDAMKL